MLSRLITGLVLAIGLLTPCNDPFPSFLALVFVRLLAEGLYLPVDETTQLARIRARWLQAPDTTFAISEQDLASWRAHFEVPTADELAGDVPPRPPAVYESWSAWASARWPSLPLLDEVRL